jgi:subtilase family serine protease
MTQSFGEAESCMKPTTLAAQHGVFALAATLGWTVFAATGDTGSAMPTCDQSSLFRSAAIPASDPLVTAVGGTHLSADVYTGAYGSEQVWNNRFGAGGGGFSSLFRQPVYQRVTSPGQIMRGIPDVAYDGDVVGGVLVVWSGMGRPGLFVFGGTSAGSPQWAGLAAIGDQMAGRRLGFVNIALYRLASGTTGAGFHDITSGGNGFGGVDGFVATAGWDAASGLGTPDAAALLAALSQRPTT